MTVSVIIPTYLRISLLRSCLKALARQQFHQAWEVIVINDGGRADELEKLIQRFGIDLNIQVFHQENTGPAAARNLGAEKAKGEFLAFLDDDCAPAPNWLHHLFAHCKQGQMTGGYTQNLLPHNPYSEASQQLVAYLYEAFFGTPWYFFTTNNLMVSRRDFMDVGRFDTQFQTAAGEDRAFCLEWTASGRSMRYIEEAIVNHQHHLTFRSFWKQHFNYGKAAKTYQQCLKEKQMRLRPSLNFYLILLRYPLNREGRLSRKLILCLLLLISQLATFLGYIFRG